MRTSVPFVGGPIGVLDMLGIAMGIWFEKRTLPVLVT